MTPPAIILVNPQLGENIGAAARVMGNFGLSDLRLVRPRDGWPNQRAIDLSSGAFDHMPEPRIFDTLQDASADLHRLYATTARSRDMVKPVYTPDAAIEDGKKLCANGDSKIGFVFGPERTGLENEDVAQCHSIINVPTNPDFSSLNLGQCVLLIAYAIGRATIETDDATLPMGDSMPVTQDKLNEFLERLEESLVEADFFKSEGSQASISQNVRNIFVRGNLSDQEVRTLHGILTSFTRPLGQK